MRIQVLPDVYRGKTDEELLELAARPEQLTAEALSALTAELTIRRLNFPKPTNTEPDEQPRRRDQVFDPERDSPHVELRGFVTEVLRLYRANAWILIKLSVPATLVMYLTRTAVRSEVHRIARNISSHRAVSPFGASLALELGLINLAQILTIWLVTCLLFAATCSAVDHIKSGLAPGFSDCFAEIGRQLGRFLGVSFVLLVVVAALIAMAELLSLGAFWSARQAHVHLHGLLFWSLTYGPVLAAFIVGTRFSLAMPAVLLDDYPVGRSILLSDTLTEDKWLILTVLVLKYLIAGYIGGLLPFWIRIWLWNLVQLPEWCAVAGSIAAVAMIEPPMFVALALLYLRLTETATTPGSIPRTQFASGPKPAFS